MVHYCVFKGGDLTYAPYGFMDKALEWKFNIFLGLNKLGWIFEFFCLIVFFES